jgi:spermidine synthase
LSCYHQAGQNWTIYEIDPQMVEVARSRFSFLSRCAPDARIVLGDARISLRERTAPNSLDILAVDAFTSDAVPMHLLTREALAEYGRAVQRDGIVLFHISNRYLDLKPVVADIAASGGWASAMMVYQPTPEEADLNATISVWIALSRNPEALRRLIEASGEDGPNWEALDPTPGFSGWTDDHASILPILNYPSWMPFVGRR